MSTELIETNDPIADAAHLIYRVRPGAIQAPLIVMIHGLGGDENVMWIFEYVLPKYATVIAPRAPIWIEPNTPYAEEASGGYSWLRPAPLPRPDRSTLKQSLEMLRKFIEAAITKYQAAQNQIYLLGFSQGAALGYALSLAIPDRVNGVIALAGFMPESMEKASPPDVEVSDLPKHGYLILHGLEDDRVPIAYARQARSILQSIGAKVEYHEYPIGHKISPQGLKDIEMWLKRSTGDRGQQTVDDA
jgi:phospholipase/carboxylesterase